MSCGHYRHRSGCSKCSRMPGVLGCTQWCNRYRRSTDQLCTWCGELADAEAEAALVRAAGGGIVTYSAAITGDANFPAPPPNLPEIASRPQTPQPLAISDIASTPQTSHAGPSDHEMNDIAAKIALLGHLVEQLGHRVDVLEDNLRARMDALEARCSGIEGSLEQWSWQ